MISYPFTSKVTYDSTGQPEFDRAVDAEILREINKGLYSNGVGINPSTNMQVTANSGMEIIVNAGYGMIQGVSFYETQARALTLEASNSQDRIDTVVIRLNDNTDIRSIDLYIVKGTPASTPKPPALTRSASIYELGIANIFVAKNTSTITHARITDTRQDVSRCGYMLAVQTVDTTSLYKQYEDEMDRIIAGYDAAISGTMAGELQNEIDTKVDKADIANSLDVDKAGKVLDARMGKLLGKFYIADFKVDGKWAEVDLSNGWAIAWTVNPISVTPGTMTQKGNGWVSEKRTIDCPVFGNIYPTFELFENSNAEVVGFSKMAQSWGGEAEFRIQSSSNLKNNIDVRMCIFGYRGAL